MADQDTECAKLAARGGKDVRAGVIDKHNASVAEANLARLLALASLGPAQPQLHAVAPVWVRGSTNRVVVF
eukprot:1860489-Alexandrium_andersonii.AAC.1